jgi:hypothetical protein
MRRLLSVFAVVTAVVSVAPGPSQADATSTRVPVSFVTGDICGADGEPIAVEGQMHIVYAFTSQDEGVFHEQQIAQAHLVGVGLVSGDRYILNSSSETSESVLSNGNSLVMHTEHAVRIHAGETTPFDDFYMRFTFNPGGYSVDISGCR